MASQANFQYYRIYKWKVQIVSKFSLRNIDEYTRYLYLIHNHKEIEIFLFIILKAIFTYLPEDRFSRAPVH